jgi:hypothetical protein
VGPNALLRNDGNGTFTDVTAEAGVGDPGWGASCAFIDYDADGNLDLFITNYVRWSASREIVCRARGGRQDYCSPKSYQAPAPDTLYRNLGGGRFEDVSRAAGLGRSFGNGLGVACADYDSDGDLDLYVANDGTPNQLWVNDGAGRFTDEAVVRGCAVNGQGMSEAGMGVAAIDLENDGRVDLFMSHLAGQSNTLYLNQGSYFQDSSAVMGVGSVSRPFTGFGLGFVDFDHDGLVDLYVANGRVGYGDIDFDSNDPYAEPNLLLRGKSDRRFEEVLPRGGTAVELIATSRAAAFGDLDNDGDVDIVVVNRDARVHVLRNTVGDGRGWIMLRLLDERGRHAEGAVVRIETAAGAQSRVVQRASSYCASNDSRVHFGLGAATAVDAVEVRWLDGRRERFGPFAAGAVHDVRRGAGAAAEGE